eukprot:TRINITY_DN94188_c0_g1_i1.p1 TRINITY_DN94188_c0_g1~~TRINITY_DN94188_c0_g1_i1.p1  ORF type:complete len:307 (-),score=26.90 TRINITY_DN94188_c0_g1_i1:127-1047(-)
MQGHVVLAQPCHRRLVIFVAGTVLTLSALKGFNATCRALSALWTPSAREAWNRVCLWCRTHCFTGSSQLSLHEGDSSSVSVSEGTSQRAGCAEENCAYKVQREVLIDAASSARLASSLLPDLRARYPTNTDLDRHLGSLRQFSYLMREIDMVEEKFLEAAKLLTHAPSQEVALDTRVCKLALPLVEGVRAKRSMVQWALCLQRSAGSSEEQCAAGRLLECLPSLAPLILSFLMSARQSAELILYCPGLRTNLITAAERLICRSDAAVSDELALPGFEERLAREIIQGSPPSGQRRSFRQRTECRRH